MRVGVMACSAKNKETSNMIKPKKSSEDENRRLPAYEETCNSLRHYSNASLAVRVMSVVQGMVLIGVWAVNLPKREIATDIVVPLFGLLFTVFLFRFHIGYFNATGYFYKIATRMEKELFDSGFRPFGEYDKCHTKGTPIRSAVLRSCMYRSHSLGLSVLSL